MRARRLLNGASFGPESMNAIGQAFDAAWESIGGNFGDAPKVLEEARYRLANCILSVAAEDRLNVEAPKKSALEAMATRYRVTADLGGPFSR
jgi:hypothetical protein